MTVFKNSLLYTTAFEISTLIPKANGDTAIIIISSIMLVVIAINKCSALVDTLFVDVGRSEADDGSAEGALQVLFDCASNLLVQITSTMVGQLVTTAVQETNDTSFSLVGSMISLTLIWLLSNMIASR